MSNGVTAKKSDHSGRLAGSIPTVTQLYQDGHITDGNDVLAEEVAVAISYCSQPFAVMLATPTDLREYAVGFTLSEGIVECVEEIHAIAIGSREINGISVDIKIAKKRLARIDEQSRSLMGHSGCGLCGKQQLSNAMRSLPHTSSSFALDAKVIDRVAEHMQPLQEIYGETGSVHAAAWGNCEGEVVCIKEDVGRHNAMDKLIGALVGMKTDFSSGFVVMTSRMSTELVQKLATLRISAVVSFSAPTSLAVETAKVCGITLVRRIRSQHHIRYS